MKKYIFFLKCSLLGIVCIIKVSSLRAQEKERVILPERPNIMMITCEDISPIIGTYGDKVVKTPNIDQLAKEGVKYMHMYSVSGVCAPSRSALATGMYPTSIGTHNMRTLHQGFVEDLPSYSVVVPEGVRHYAEIMREDGYYVTNNVKNDYQFEGPITAWDEVSETAGYHKRAKGQPFFAIYNSTLSHESKVWGKANDPLLVDPKDVPVPPYYPQDNAIIRQDIARVYSNIMEMDQWVGSLISQLEKDGLMDETIIIFYSDHGGPLPRQKRELYDSGLKVPFIVKYPGAQLAGTIDEELHSFVDIPPTVLSLAGVEIPKYMQGEAFLGKQAQTQPRKYIFAARDRMDAEHDRVRAVRDKRFKYFKNYYPEKPFIQQIDFRLQMNMMNELIRLHEAGELNEVQELWFRKTKPEEELYDVENDPYELNNLISDPKYTAKVKELRAALTAWLDTYGDMGAFDERKLIHKMWNGGNEPPETKKAIYSFNDKSNLLLLSCPTPSATIGYQLENEIGNDRWRVYKEPIAIKPGQKVKIKAHRIGYEPSEPVVFEYNPKKGD